MVKMAIDDLDRQLIQLLQSDAHQSSELLAKQLGISASTARRRMLKLVQSGVLRIVAAVDPSKIGSPLLVVIAFDIDHDKIDLVTQRLASRPDIRWVSITTGRFDVLVMAQFACTNDLFNFMQRDVATMEGVRDSETFVCLHMVKAHYMQA